MTAILFNTLHLMNRLPLIGNFICQRNFGYRYLKNLYSPWTQLDLRKKSPVLVPLPFRTLVHSSRTLKDLLPQESLMKRCKNKLDFMIFGKSRLRRAGFILYEQAIDSIDVMHFIKKLELEDTFNSWFMLVALHIWMCMVRLSAEGENGRFVRNCLVEALWNDVDGRSKLLGEFSASIRKKSVEELDSQFIAMLCSYDEGLMSSDQILASALWRILFNQNCNKPELIELMVEYIRRQIKHLDSQNEIIKGKISWLS